MASAVKYVKTYVDVLVKMRTDGTFIPVKVLWDEREFDVDSVVKITMSPPQFVGSIRASRAEYPGYPLRGQRR